MWLFPSLFFALGTRGGKVGRTLANSSADADKDPAGSTRRGEVAGTPKEQHITQDLVTAVVSRVSLQQSQSVAALRTATNAGPCQV